MPLTVEGLAELERTLTEDIARMRTQIKVARQIAFSERGPLDQDWYRKVNYAITMQKQKLVAAKNQRGALQRKAKENRHLLELHKQSSQQACFMRQAKKRLPKKLFDEIYAAALVEVSEDPLAASSSAEPSTVGELF